MKHQIMTVMLDAFLIINALPPKFLQKRFPLYFFSMVHLLHRLYGVDAPEYKYKYTPSKYKHSEFVHS